jgi:hypothetical protein
MLWSWSHGHGCFAKNFIWSTDKWPCGCGMMLYDIPSERGKPQMWVIFLQKKPNHHILTPMLAHKKKK